MSIQDHAQRYAELGWFVFPTHAAQGSICTCGRSHCKNPGKHPVAQAAPRGRLSARNDVAVVGHWFGLYPWANIGVATGPSGLIVLDADLYKPEVSIDWLPPFETVTGLSGGGGTHFVFEAPPFDVPAVALPGGVELKGSTGQFHVAPSVHKSGRQYAWKVSPWDMPPAPLPAEIMQVIKTEMHNRALRQAEAEQRRAQLLQAGDADALRIAELLTYIPPTGHDYNTGWIKILAAIYAAMPGDDGIAIAEAWCGEHCYRGEIAQKWASFAKDGIQVSVGSLYHFAMAYGYQGGNGLGNVWDDALTVERYTIAALPWADDAQDDPRIAQEGAEDGDESECTVGSMVEAKAVEGEISTPEHTLPYVVINGRIEFVKGNDKYEPVADFTAAIVRQIDDEETGRVFVIGGKAKFGDEFEFEVPADELGKANTLAGKFEAAAGARSGIYHGMGKHLSHAVKRLTRGAEVVTRYRRIGWNEEGYYMIGGREKPGLEFVLENQMSGYCIPETARIERGVEGLRYTIEAIAPHLTLPVITLAMLAPLASRTGVSIKRFAAFIRGRTGSYKTEWAKLCMSLYGDFASNDDNYIKFGAGATSNYMQSIALAAKDAPLLFDNYKPNTTKADEFVSLIQTIMEGRERGRLNQDLTARSSRSFGCWPIITGEDTPSSDAATLARQIVIPFPSQRGGWNVKLSRAQEQAHHLPAVGLTWIEWLEGEGTAIAKVIFAEQMGSVRQRWAEQLVVDNRRAANGARIAANLASLECTYLTAMEHPVLGALFAEYGEEFNAGLREIARYMAASTANSLEAIRYLEALIGLMATGQARILDLADPLSNSVSEHSLEKVVGWMDTGTIYLHPALARSAIERHHGDELSGMSNTALYDQLASIDMYAVGADPRPSPKSIPNGFRAANSPRSQRVLWLDRGQWDELAGQERVITADVLEPKF